MLSAVTAYLYKRHIFVPQRTFHLRPTFLCVVPVLLHAAEFSFTGSSKYFGTSRGLASSKIAFMTLLRRNISLGSLLSCDAMPNPGAMRSSTAGRSMSSASSGTPALGTERSRLLAPLASRAGVLPRRAGLIQHANHDELLSDSES